MKLFASIIATCALGFGAAFLMTRIGTAVVHLVSEPKIVTIDMTPPSIASLSEVVDTRNLDEEDPYSVIESAKDSLPHQTTKKISAPAYIVIDANTGSVIAEKDANRARPIASITKLVTAMTARTLFAADARIEITKSAFATEGNTARLRVGETFTLAEILYPLFMVSSNDAAEAIAGSYGRRQFIRAMNDWTASIGAYQTYFKDPSGLSPENTASARDIATIMQYIATHTPDILNITHTKTKSIRIHTWTNAAHFLNLVTYRGGKNGFTDEAGRTGVSVFETKARDGKSHVYIIVVLDSTNRDHDVLTLLQEASTQ